MTTKFNKKMYKKIKEKKNEPLSNIGQRRLRITDKEKERERNGGERFVHPCLRLRIGLGSFSWHFY